MRRMAIPVISCVLLLLAGCGPFVEKATDSQVKGAGSVEVPAYTASAKEPVHAIMTTDKAMALTFNGLADRETTYRLLDALEEEKGRATFFLPGIRVAEEPALAKEILERGHDIQNNTLNGTMPAGVSYEEAYMEISLANRVFKDVLKIEPQYVRTRSGDSGEAFEQASGQIGMKLVTNTINPKDGDMKSAEDIAEYIVRFSTRGAIIQLNTNQNPEVVEAIPLIYENAESAGYRLTSLEELASGSYEEGDYMTNQLQKNERYEEVEPVIIERFPVRKKQVALTFDDWASDHTVTRVLEILKEHDVKATFFLIGKGAEANPPLARLIYEEGHEIANHSFSHTNLDGLTADQVQEDVIRADEAIAAAIRGTPANYFRPAKGEIDHETARKVSAAGVDSILLYDVSAHDWNLDLTGRQVYNRVMERTQPGSIITMHILDESHTLEVLPRILEDLKARGYEFRTVGDFLSGEY